MKISLPTQKIQKVIEASIYVSTSLITFFIYFNVVEKVFFVDLPVANSVTSTSFATTFLDNQVQAATNQSDSTDYGFYGEPATFSFPREDISVPLSQSLRRDSNWLISTTALNYVITQSPKGGRIGEIIVFAPQNHTYSNFLSAIEIGDTVAVTTHDNWKMKYQVVKRYAAPEPEPTISNKNTLILVKKLSEDSSLILEAEFKSLEERLK